MDRTLMERALDAAGLAVLVLDEGDRVLDATRAAALLLGRADGDLTGRPVADLLPPCPVLTGPRSESGIEVSGCDAAGRPLHLAIDLACWTDPGGQRRKTLVLRDSTAEREKARSTQRNLIQSDLAIRGANIGVFEFDLATQSVVVSEIWRRMLELDPDETLDVQAEWRGRVHPEDLSAALEPIRLCGGGLAERASCEYRLQSRDRTHWRWMRTDIAVAQRDEAGQPVMLVGAQTDVTARKEAEEALRVSIEQLSTAFEYTPIGKAIVGLDGGWRRVNPALCDLLGYEEADILGAGFQSFTHPDDLAADQALLDALRNGEIPPDAIEKRYIRSDGSVMWGRLSVGLVRDVRGRPDHFIAEIVDVTEQRRLDQIKTEFVSVVSHELRTPLTSILGALSLLSTYDEDQFPDDFQRLLFIARTNGDRLHNLVNDILDFQKFSAREMRFAPSRQMVAPLVEETLMANLHAAERNGLHYASRIRDRGMRAMVDAKRFHQVMANLLSNACKFAAADSVVEVAAERQGAAIRIAVSNIGPGIPEAFRSRVFKPFSQAAAASDRRSGGTGLGLSISRQIVEQMGGEIGFDSVPEGKTTFWFTIPAADERQAGLSADLTE